ncbi:MAG: metallophosphoesterase, partial [Bacteroidota bacterium]
MPWIVRLILFVSLMLLSEYYFFRRVFSSIKTLFPDSSFIKFKAVKITLLFVINFVPTFYLFTWILEFLGGPDINLPDKNRLFDILFYYSFWVAIIIFLQTVVIILPVDLIRFTFLSFNKKIKSRIDRLTAKFILFVMVIFLIYVPIRIVIDMTQVSSRTTTYELENLNEDLNNLRIGVISDIQADWYNSEKRIKNYIDELNKTKPDLVLIPGDMITRNKESIPVAAKMVGKIESNYGVYACVGDHDNWAYGRNILKSRNEVIKQLAEYGVSMLDNNNSILQIENSRIGMTFITDTYSERIKNETLDSLTNNINNVDLKILITHQPNGKTREMASEKDYNLMVAGHTHGGQITLFFPFINLTP